MTLHIKPNKSAQHLARSLKGRHFMREVGQITEVAAAKLNVSLPNLPIGELCEIRDNYRGLSIKAQVIGARDGQSSLAPLEDIAGLSVGADVYPLGISMTVPVGDALIGRTLDGLGRPLDGEPFDMATMSHRSILPRNTNPMSRPAIDDTVTTGIRAIDGFMSLGIGQRMAVFGEAGAGKSTLLSMLAAGPEADVIVIGMIGERGREVREFVERQLPEAVRARCIVVAATSDRPALERINGGHIAATIAEHFRDQGKNVLLLFDSVTRFARALREVGLANGEDAVRGGFTPSVYAELPRLVERCGRTDKGAITAFFTVLLENDGVNDPLSEEITSLTDGHIILDAKIAQSGIYPAINILKSKSRLMNELVSKSHQAHASHVRHLMAKYLDIELLVQVGEFAEGQDPIADAALAAQKPIREFLKQDQRETASMQQTTYLLQELALGHAGG